jgi:hypothetical protein
MAKLDLFLIRGVQDCVVREVSVVACTHEFAFGDCLQDNSVPVSKKHHGVRKVYEAPGILIFGAVRSSYRKKLQN